MVKLKELLTVLPIVSLVVVFLAMFYFADDLGFDADIDTDFLLLLPGLAAFVIGITLFAITRGMYAFPALMVVGIGLAQLFGTLDTMGMITSQMKAGLTIAQIQLWIIVIFSLVGGISNAIAYRSR